MASVLELILRTKKQGTGAKDTSKELMGLEKLAKKVGIAFVAMAAAKTIKNATLLAARVETLGVVTKKLGENVGMTEKEIRSLERAIVDQGITLQGSRQAIAMMIQSNVDLAHATDLARLAQDTAVIANLNSSQAFQQLTYVLQTGNVRMARTLGLNVQFGKAQRELAKELGIATSALSEEEIMLARTNAVMEAGERIAGTYEAAMETAGKKILSMDRMVEELQRALGEVFLPVLEEVVTLLYEAAKAMLAPRQAAKDHESGVDELTDSYKAGTVSEADYVLGLQAAQRALEESKKEAGFMEGALLTLQQARIAAIFILKSETFAGEDSIDARREQILLAERLNTRVHDLSVNYGKLGAAEEDAKEETEGLTEAQYFEMAAEALLAGNTRLAQHYVDMATATGEAREETLALIAALQELDGMSVSYNMVGFHQSMGGPSWLDQGIGPATNVGGGAGTPAGGFATYAEGVAAGMVFENGKWVPATRQHGGPVQAGGSYIVGEREAELFVPRQDGDIYNQQQLAGGDININSGVSQRAFNNMAEDWMRGLGG